jgi:hypothetical protein
MTRSTIQHDLRCPVTPRTLFAKLSTPDVTIGDRNVISIACDSCKRELRRRGQRVALVVHRYNMIGQLLGTDITDARAPSLSDDVSDATS